MSLAPSYTTPQEVEDLQLRVSLSSSAGRINLWPNAKGDGFKLHTKVDGLGVADSVNTMTSLPSGGAVLRHQRLKEGDMFLPIQIRSNSKKARNDLKTKLEQILTPAKGPVKVEVMDPYTKDTRSRTTYYRTGLGAPDWSGPNSALYGITLDYAEPWWRGAVRGRKIKVADRKKPFLTGRNIRPAEGAIVHREDRAPTSADAGSTGDVWFTGRNAEPERTTETNLWRGSKLSEDRSAVGKSSNMTWEQTGEGLELTAISEVSSASSYLWTNGGYRVSADSNVPYSWAIPVKNTGEVPFPVNLYTWLGRSTSGAVTKVDKFVLAPGETRVAKLENLITEDADDIRFSLYYNANADKPVEGAKITLLDGITLTSTETAVSPFNGDTPAAFGKKYRWLEDGTSEEYLPARDFKPTARYIHDGSSWVKQQPNPAIPFFPVFVYSSVVEGVYTLDIEGDEEVWPTWEIGGPGTDLLIENMTTGEALFIEGDIFEKITIVTDPQLQDIYSDTWADGQWWDRVDIKQGALFPLEAGENKIKVTMVGATQASYVKYSYEEIWGAPY